MGAYVERLESRRLLSTYYVATTGSDSGAGSQAVPFATLQHAANLVVAGDTVKVEAGTYVGFSLSYESPQSGTANSPITFEADPAAAKGSVILDSASSRSPSDIDLEPGSDYVIINGFNLQNDGTVTQNGIKDAANHDTLTNNIVKGVGRFGIFTNEGSYNTIEYNNISGTIGTNTSGHGIYLSGSTVGSIVAFNVIDGNGYIGIHLDGQTTGSGVAAISNVTIANNLIYNNPGNGINGDGVTNSVIENNLIYGFTVWGISLYTIDAGVGSSGNLIVNNTIVGSHALELQDNATGNVVFNNILLGNVSVDSTSSDAASNNITSGSTSSLFVNASGGNYNLLSTSPAVGEGVASFDENAAPATDLLGNGRVKGRYDAGAYEYMSYIPGDANMDGVVNFTDFQILSANFNKTWATWAQGDFNGDGVVNFADFQILSANFNAAKLVASQSVSAAVQVVPAVVPVAAATHVSAIQLREGETWSSEGSESGSLLVDSSTGSNKSSSPLFPDDSWADPATSSGSGCD